MLGTLPRLPVIARAVVVVAGASPTATWLGPVMVAKVTTGTAAWVESIVVVEERTDPDAEPVVSVQGTTIVVWISIVVTGSEVKGAEVVDTLDAHVTMAGFDGM